MKYLVDNEKVNLLHKNDRNLTALMLAAESNFF